MNSVHWIRHAAITKLRSILDTLVASGSLDYVHVGAPTAEYLPAHRVAGIYGGTDSQRFAGVGGDMELEATIVVRLWGSHTASEGVVLSVERLAATVRDAIADELMAFHQLDPPMQLEGVSITDDPSYGWERDLAAVTLEVRVAAH